MIPTHVLRGEFSWQPWGFLDLFIFFPVAIENKGEEDVQVSSLLSPLLVMNVHFYK